MNFITNHILQYRKRNSPQSVVSSYAEVKPSRAMVMTCPITDTDTEDSPTSSTQEETILDILGEERVERIVERFYHYNLTDKNTRAFFQGINVERLQRMQTRFLVHLLGGKAINTRKMRAAHKRLLDLNDRHFDAVLSNLRKAVKDMGISRELALKIMAAAETTRDDVLGRTPLPKRQPSDDPDFDLV